MEDFCFIANHFVLETDFTGEDCGMAEAMHVECTACGTNSTCVKLMRNLLATAPLYKVCVLQV